MKKLLILFFISAFFATNLWAADNLKTLRKKQATAKKNIEMTNKLLNDTKKSQKSTVSNLTLIKKQIVEREKLISSLNNEISILDADLDSLNTQITTINNRLDLLKNEYAKLVNYAYFHKSTKNELLYVFSAETINQAYRRLRYVQELSAYRKKQSQEIQTLSDSLTLKLQEIQVVKKDKAIALIGRQNETSKLQQSQKDKEKILQNLSAKEKELKAKLKKQQEQVNRLNAQIEKMIAKEIAEAERRAKAKAEAKRKAQQKNTSTSKQTPIAKPTEQVVSGGFDKNKGRLPWPVKGTITGHFGVHPHPVLKQVMVNNKGIYIQTPANSDACAIYEGEVTQIFAIPGNNNAIIVKHGNYRTVYANITTTYVKSGDKVSAKQKLGKIFVDTENDNKTELYFMLYKGANLENPENWLVK